MIEIICPWPPAELSPNARGHWAKKAKAAKLYRARCYNLATQARHIAWRYSVETPAEGSLVLRLTICPPDNRKRDDDNIIAAFKSGRDGIADALGIDDNRFELRIKRGEVIPGGRIIVEVFAESGE